MVEISNTGTLYSNIGSYFLQSFLPMFQIRCHLPYLSCAAERSGDPRTIIPFDRTESTHTDLKAKGDHQRQEDDRLHHSLRALEVRRRRRHLAHLLIQAAGLHAAPGETAVGEEEEEERALDRSVLLVNDGSRARTARVDTTPITVYECNNVGESCAHRSRGRVVCA